MSSEPREIIVTCAGTSETLERVAGQLRELEFEVDKILESVGCITGRWAGDLSRLENIPDVIAAEESEENYPR